MIVGVVMVAKKNGTKETSPNPLQAHRYLCGCRYGCVLSDVGLGLGEWRRSRLLPVAVAAGGRGMPEKEAGWPQAGRSGVG